MNAETESAAARLCGACGMCCNGVLFHAVVLQPGDSPRTLAALGLRVKRKGNEVSFAQPCAAHLEASCAIYEQRPVRCRAFACRQLRRMTAGEITETEAIARVRAARDGVERVQRLMDRITKTNPRRPLARRVANALTGTPPEMAPLRTELETAMCELEVLLTRDFRVEST